ncbi:MAG: hypothetical protein K2L70_07310 [Clostridia bacterium]|nr:hypothetical protein [Clostridia bacterium]
MNLTKKSKLTALITVAVMCLAIIITAGVIFAPKFYKNSDTQIETAANNPYSGYDAGGYGMTKDITFDKSNMALALARQDQNDHVWIYFPSTIYMDVTENLQSLKYGYHFYAHFGSSSNTDYYHTLFHSTMGYYLDGSGNQNGKYLTAWQNEANMMRYFNNYTFISNPNNDIDLEWGSPDVYGGVKGSNNKAANWTWNQSGGDNVSYTVTDYNGGNYYSSTHMRTDCRMFGTPSLTGTFNYQRLANTPIFLTHEWGNRVLGMGGSKVYKWTLSSTVDANTAAAYGQRPEGVSADIPILDDIKITINLYDKSSLLNAMKTLDNKYNAIVNTGLLIGGEDNRYTAFKKDIIENYLNKREVTQAQLSDKVAEVNSYVFNTYISNPSLGYENSPQTVDYTGAAYGLNNFWKEYNSNIPNTSTLMSNCFISGTMNYYATGFDGSATPVDNGKKNNITEAGYYTVTFAPDSNVRTITVGGYNINVKFTWQDKTVTERTAYLWIKPAEIILSPNMATSVEMAYKGNTPNTITGLPSGAQITLKGSGNTATVQLSDIKRSEENVLAWNGVGDTLEFPDVTEAPQKVYFRISANNHVDKYGEFTVKINPADISIKIKHFDQTFNSNLLDSDGIFKEMLDGSTPKILDAMSFEESKNYLQDILTFVILKNDGNGYFDPAVDKPNAGNYTISVVKNEAWAKRINNISFVDASNSNAYQITPKAVEVTWTDKANKWYDNARGHRPDAKLTEGQDTCGQMVGLTSVDVLGDKGTDLDASRNAVNAGTYTAKVESTNPNFVISNYTHEFTIYPRKITVDIQNRQTVYAASGDIDTQSAQYYNVILKNNTNNEAYIATLDTEIATLTGQTSALVHNDYNDVFTVNIKPFAPNGTAGNYYAAGDHTLEFVSLNSNYEITGIDGKFTVLPANLTVSIQQLPPKVYNAETQDIILELTPGADGNVVLYGYELEHFDECVKIEYSATGHDGSWSETPLTITNVIESPKTVYYKVSAPNHTDYVGNFTEEMTAVNIMVYFDGQKDTVYYGSEIPTSDQLLTICNHRFTVSEKLVDEGGGISSEDIKDIHPSVIFDFYLLDPKTGQAVVNRNADAGSYTVTHRLKAGVSEDINNFNVIYHLDETTGVRDNVNAYTISPKPLQVVWEQSGDRWTGEGKDHYIFSNIIPTVFPTAPNSYDGKENVVTGDSIYLAGIELAGSRVNVEGYTVTTKLTTDRNQRNYVLVDDTHTFYIDPLEVKIVIKDQYAKYGQARQIPLGELIDPISVGAIWDYAQGSEARFFSNHYSNYKFISQAHSTDGSALVDVGEYPIGITANTKDGMDGTIRDNYKVTVVTTEEGKSGTFHITPADIHFTGRQYNIAYDLKEDTVLTKNTLIDRISTGLEDRGVDASQFTVLMSERFLQTDTSINENNATWVDATTAVTKDIDCAKYYVLLKVTHPQGNFNPFVAKVELNILSNWVSVIIGKGVTDAEYGYTVFPSEKIFDKLDIVSIAGFMTESGEQLWNTNQDEAKNLLKQYVQLYVGLGDLKTEMEKNASVGDYSIYMRVIKTGEYENFRFLPREGESDTSNINAYHVGPRTITVTWDGMDEEYGDHGNSHTGYTIVGVVSGEEDLVRFELTYSIDMEVERNTARFEGGHAFAAGYYVAQVVGVSNPNYTIDPDDKNLTTTFVIKPKEIEIDLHDRTFVYGVENTRIDKINETLNVYSQTPNYDVVSKSPFVGSDKRDSIFEIYFDGSIADGLNYLPAGEYVINARQVFTTVSVNYQVTVRNTGKLKIDKASAGLSVKQLTTLYFNASDQVVKIDRDWLVLSGDADVIRENAAVSYKFISREDYRDTTTTEYTPEGEYTVRDSGRYVISVQIEADNHETYITDVNLNVTPANVIINMSQAEKTYGDTLADMISKAQNEGIKDIATLSDWLKVKCGITIEMYRDFGGGNRPQWDITEYALQDFEFYVVDPNNVSGDGGGELQPGSYQNNVGEYRVYHRMASGALASNYIVEYYQEPGVSSKCNAHAYKIIPRPVNVSWDVTDKADWNTNHTQYYYTGHTPGLVAMFYALADESGEQPSVRLQIDGMENVNVNADGGHYTAKVVHSNWESNQYANNYTLKDDTYEYSIVKRPIRVTIDDQYKGVYGSVNGGIEVSQGEFSIYDIKADANIDTLQGNPIELVLENVGLGADKLLPAGSYKISGICHNDNYEVTFVGKDGGDYGWLTVNKAVFSLTTTTYRDAKYLGVEFTLDFKSILPVNKDAFVSGDDWESAWENAKITYQQNGTTVDKPVFTGAGIVRVTYTLSFDNYQDFTSVFEIDVQKAIVNVSLNEVSSDYGDELLDSEGIFANANVTLADGSDPIRIAIEDIITLFVDGNAVNAGKYNIDFNYVGDEANNFVVNLVDNYGKYEIKPRVVKIIWAMDEDDSAFDGEGYVFDGKPHKIIFDVDNVLDGDTIEPRFEETSQKDQAKTYTARLISIGKNGNYAMPENCSFEWTIKPRLIGVTWTVGDYTYDGTYKIPTAQINADEVLLGTSCGLNVSGGEIDAGNYEALATATSSNYKIANATQAFTIKPKQIQIDWSNDTFVYDGQLHAPTATIRDGELCENDKVEDIRVGGAQKNAGTYTATVTGLDNPNYIVVGATKTFVIEKKVVTIHWTDTQLDYTGEEITPNASVNIGDIISGDSVSVEISGGKKDVGTYTATAIGVTNGNYVLAPNTVKEMQFTIEKVNNEFNGLFGKGDSNSDIVGVPWTGEDKPTNKFGGEVIIKYYEDEACTKEVDVNKIKDGTYWAVAYVAGTDNYNELVSNPLMFTIDNGMNIGLAVSAIVISIVLLGAVLTIILVVNKKRKGGNV